MPPSPLPPLQVDKLSTEKLPKLTFYGAPGSWRHRTALRLFASEAGVPLDIIDFLSELAVMCAGVLAILLEPSLAQAPTSTDTFRAILHHGLYASVIAYAVLFVVKLLKLRKRKRSYDLARQAMAVHTRRYLGQASKSTLDARITLLRPDSLFPNVLRPWMRLEPGTDAYVPAKSKSSFPFGNGKGVGLAGLAAVVPSTIHFTAYPKFNNIQDRDRFLTGALMMDHSVIERLSEMTNARAKIAYGLAVDGRLMTVVCFDFFCEIDPQNPPFDSDVVRSELDRLGLLLNHLDDAFDI